MVIQLLVSSFVSAINIMVHALATVAAVSIAWGSNPKCDRGLRLSSIWRAPRCCTTSMAKLASRGIAFHIVGARGQVGDVLQADGLAEKTGSANWTRRMDSVLGDLKIG
jgi:hypothetical protein